MGELSSNDIPWNRKKAVPPVTVFGSATVSRSAATAPQSRPSGTRRQTSQRRSALEEARRIVLTTSPEVVSSATPLLQRHLLRGIFFVLFVVGVFAAYVWQSREKQAPAPDLSLEPSEPSQPLSVAQRELISSGSQPVNTLPQNRAQSSVTRQAVGSEANSASFVSSPSNSFTEASQRAAASRSTPVAQIRSQATASSLRDSEHKNAVPNTKVRADSRVPLLPDPPRFIRNTR